MTNTNVRTVEWYRSVPAPDFAYTASGTAVSFIDPKPEQILPEDIAHHLSLINRFNGGTIFPYSVAQHSMVVADIVPKKYRLRALLHDAHEAYCGDITMPVKRRMGSTWYDNLCNKVDDAIASRFGIAGEINCDIITRADRRACEAEIVDLVVRPEDNGDRYGKGMIFLERPWRDVHDEFLERLKDLSS